MQITGLRSIAYNTPRLTSKEGVFRVRIIIDGQRIPINVRATKDLLLTLKSMAKTLNWKIWYDPGNEVIYLSSAAPAVTSPAEESELSLHSIDEFESSRLQGKIICLDPGHGGSDPGAVGPSGTMEKNNTLAIALLLKEKLENNGATVLMTRETDQDVSYPNASSAEELGARINIASDANADLFISIHNDAFTSITAAGTTTFHYGDEESVDLAGHVQKCLVEELGTKDRGTRFGSFYVIRYAKMPAILVEIAFISNPEEELLLASTDGRAKSAESIFKGIVKYFKV
ncbi:N-acetylmuramoyl-L-alanine amidase [Sporomusaceae bacterium FL31]|nr:N-acetylmuramoyl-L-alanine amidase [Sporomusaceae bacterium FL31]GCE35896.1 N-acetylmuramoyl-L-alanine amidase [Sporomusaceae bacterium]